MSIIFVGLVGCSIGTDNSASEPEKSLNQLKLTSKDPRFKSEDEATLTKLTLAEGSGTKADGHPKVDNKAILREIVVPSEVKSRWNAVKILVVNKEDEESGIIKTVKLGTSIIPEGSGLKVTVGPFLPNFIMDKTIYTSNGNEELNPAVQLIVEENGKVIYKGWAFKKFPSMYAFEHQMFSFKFLGAIPTVTS